jgi:hypothetical protein
MGNDSTLTRIDVNNYSNEKLMKRVIVCLNAQSEKRTPGEEKMIMNSFKNTPLNSGMTNSLYTSH